MKGLVGTYGTRRLRNPGLLILVLLSAPLLFHASGWRFNTTGSLPKGLYLLTGETPRRGDLVFFCLESKPFIALSRERGYLGSGCCPGGLKPLGKLVYALPGDRIGIEEGGAISVNGHLISGSAARTHDSKGRPLPASLLRPGTVPPGKALVLSLYSQGSFDGRYFGLIALAGAKTMRPLWVFN